MVIMSALLPDLQTHAKMAAHLDPATGLPVVGIKELSRSVGQLLADGREWVVTLAGRPRMRLIPLVDTGFGSGSAPSVDISSIPTVSIRQVRQNSSAVLREVTQHGTRVVTVQGRPRAILVPAAATQMTLDQFDVLNAATTDTRRYELIQGDLHVAPSPDHHHQSCMLEIILCLRQALGSTGLRAIPGADWQTRGQVVCPDAVVRPVEQLRAGRLTEPPVLAVEVTSSNRATDLGLKRTVYAAGGCPAYWVLDRQSSTLLVHTLEPTTRTYPDPDVYAADGTTHQISAPFGTVAVNVSEVLA